MRKLMTIINASYDLNQLIWTCFELRRLWW